MSRCTLSKVINTYWIRFSFSKHCKYLHTILIDINIVNAYYWNINLSFERKRSKQNSVFLTFLFNIWYFWLFIKVVGCRALWTQMFRVTHQRRRTVWHLWRINAAEQFDFCDADIYIYIYIHRQTHIVPSCSLVWHWLSACVRVDIDSWSGWLVWHWLIKSSCPG